MRIIQWSERKSRTLLFVTVFCLVAPLASSLFFLEEFTWERVLFAQRQGAITAALVALGLFAYHLSFRSFTTPVLHPERHRLAWTWAGTLVALPLIALRINPELALGIGIGINILIALRLKQHVIWDALYASIGLSLLFLIANTIATTLFPSPLDDLWLSANTTGLLVLDIPLRHLTTLALLGFLWGPLLSYLKEPREHIVEVIGHRGHHIRAKAVIASAFLIAGFGGTGWFSYSFLLKPQKVSAEISTPNSVPLDGEILLSFARPVKSEDIRLSIKPEVAGSWEFRDLGLGNRTFKSLAFVPTAVFEPEQTYVIEAQDVKNVIGIGSETHSFTFTSEPLPTITGMSPIDGSRDINPCGTLSVLFVAPLSDYWKPRFTLTPSSEFEITEVDNRFDLQPVRCLEQGTTYTLTTSIATALDGNETPLTPSVSFTTITAPGLSSHAPQGDQIITTHPSFALTFSKPMKGESPEQYVSLSPSVAGQFSWSSDNTVLTYSFTEKLAFNTRYSAKIKSGMHDQAGGFFPTDTEVSFTTIGPVKPSYASPGNGSKDVKIEASFQIKFNQEVDKESVTSRFSTNPSLDGSFSWSGSMLTFTPSKPLSYSTEYAATVKAGVTAVYGQPLEKDYTWSFTTKAAPIPPATPIAMGTSEEGRTIWGYIFGSGSNVIFIHGGIHGGKERSNVVLLERLVKEVNANQSLVGSGKKIVIVPNANPDGYFGRTDKYNARGVNININFQTVGWIPWGISDEAPNAGPEPFSERESRAIRDIANKYGADTMVAFHSKGGLVNPEYGHGPSQSLAREYAKLSGYAYYEVPEWDYPGTATKWFLENGGGPSITVELTSHTVADWTVHKNALFSLIK